MTVLLILMETCTHAKSMQWPIRILYIWFYFCWYTKSILWWILGFVWWNKFHADASNHAGNL
jgi:hypothetical protein